MRKGEERLRTARMPRKTGTKTKSGTNPADAVVCWDLTPSGREGASGQFVQEEESARTRN